MDSGVPSYLEAFFPQGINQDASEFHLGNDCNNHMYTVKNITHFQREGSLLILYEGADAHGDSIAQIRQPRSAANHVGFEATQIAVKDPITDRWFLVMLAGYNIFALRWFKFTIEVGVPGWGRVETFEWRHSRGHEVRAVHEHPSSRGFKLVRLGHPNLGGGGSGGRAVRQHGEASDGCEIVAVWAAVNTCHTKRPFALEICGSGNTGELGVAFPIVALATALEIYSLGDPRFNMPKPPRPTGMVFY
ncbi:hypothetical protein GGR52DRAFT_575684 [Hypoxylon sp. FL1284]|nr:hypothetical protein GGR52DRAFT_575684 [Hypoxylon sp. FL1284]